MGKIYTDIDIINGLNLDHKNVLIKGQSGIGKTFTSKQILEIWYPKHRVLKVNGFPTSQASYTCLYQGIVNFIKYGYLEQERLALLLKRYTKLLPYLGQHLYDLLDTDKIAAYKNYISKTGLSFGVSPASHICDLLNEINFNEKFVLVYEDSQWIDSASWELLDYINNQIDNIDFFIVVIYNNKTETWIENIDSRLKSIELIELQDHIWETVELTKWPSNRIPSLIENIVNNKINLSRPQIEQIHSKSDGIPTFVESILLNLIGKGLIIKSGDSLVSNGNWNEVGIEYNIKNLIIQKIERVYSKIQNSQTLLEIASVLGDPFDFNHVDEVSLHQNSQETFLKIAKQFKILEYLFMERKWMFDNSQTRECIYESLGNLSEEIHLKVAKVLSASNHWKDYLNISFHYEKGGDLLQAIAFKFKEIERLLSVGLFKNALNLSESTGYNIIKPIPPETEEKGRFLNAICLFRNHNYNGALTLFDSLINETDSNYTKALALRWKGKLLAKLDTDKHFKSSIDCFNNSVLLLDELPENGKLRGQIYTDLVVGLAHDNNFGEAYNAYQKAEHILSVAHEKVELAKLQRRCMIFIGPKLAGPILEKLESIFLGSNMPHERVMTLVNASTQYMILSEFEKAVKVLNQAREISSEIADYGNSYIYGNLALIYMIEGKYLEAEKSINEARISEFRTVDKLVVDINEAALFLLKNGAKNSLKVIEKVSEEAEKTSELAYIVPIKLNYALALIQEEKYIKASEILKSVLVHESPYYWDNHYLKYKYLNLKHKLALLNNETKSNIKEIESKLDIEKSHVKQGIFVDHDITLIRLQFWSD